MKAIKRIIIISVFIGGFSGISLAQGPPPPPPNPAAVPIDGGLSLLLAAGAGLGTRKALQTKKETEKKPKS
ncbi:MAG: PID-CTERM protein-sorting domain-containing protein [Bacteroidia bacterium]